MGFRATKTLVDLQRVGGRLLVRCDGCGHTGVIDAQQQLTAGRPRMTPWQALAFRCGCGCRRVQVSIEVAARDPGRGRR